MDQQALAEYRYRAAREVLGGSPIGEVAERYGTTRRSLHSWRKRLEAVMVATHGLGQAPGKKPLRRHRTQAQDQKLRPLHSDDTIVAAITELTTAGIQRRGLGDTDVGRCTRRRQAGRLTSMNGQHDRRRLAASSQLRGRDWVTEPNRPFNLCRDGPEAGTSGVWRATMGLARCR